MSNSALQRGKIVFYAASGLYGFIRPDGGNEDIYFSVNQFNGKPAVDSRVMFVAEDDPRRNGRRRAMEVTPVNGGGSAA